MNRYPLLPTPERWSPKLNALAVRALRPLQRWARLRKERLLEVEVRNADIVKEALSAGCGVMITPNHPTHADPFSIYEAAYEIGSPFYIMTHDLIAGRGLPELVGLVVDGDTVARGRFQFADLDVPLQRRHP